MASSLRNSQPMNFTGRTLSDALDGTNAQRGALARLINLIPDPRTLGLWICRPAWVELTPFTGFNAPGFISALRVVGDIAYGMIASAQFPGHDEPFAYSLTGGTFLPVGGATTANTPVSPPPSGDWTPPIMKKVGSRIIVTHPGFTGGAVKFGWFDVSGFTATTTGNTDEQRTFIGDTDTAHQPYIVGLAPGTLPGAADIGFTVTGTGIAASTTIVDAENVSVIFSGDTHGTTTIDNLMINGAPDTTGLYIGQLVQGADVPLNASIATINRGAFSLTLSIATTGGGTSGEVLSSLGRQIKLSHNVTATADGTTFTFADPAVITGNPNIIGVQPGMAVAAASGITAGTSVVSTQTTEAQVTVLLSLGTNTATVYVDPGGLSVGMEVSGLGILPGTTLLSKGGGAPPAPITLSAPPTISGYSLLTFTGAQITVTPDTTGTHLGESLTISGGTAAAPLWGAGDTSPNPLPSQPVGVGQMNGRAWYALGDDGIVFSDALLPCIVSNTTAVQALLPGNGRACTAIGELQLTSLVGGIVQALVVFQGDGGMQQITGDPTTGNLLMNSMPVATGTHAPLTICSATRGLYFVSPEGLRLIDFQAKVSDPIGQDGSGVVEPFLQVSNPPVPGPLPASRMCAAANGRNVRITVPIDTDVFAEYWFDMTRGIWTGPHTSTASQIQNWSNTFVLAPTAQISLLVRSDDTQTPISGYSELGLTLSWEFQTCLLPDTGAMSENCVIESAFGVALPPGESVQVDFLNEIGQNLDGVTLAGWNVPQALWGTGLFDYTVAGPASGAYMQRILPWSQPLVFKQGVFNIRGNSSTGLVIGNLYFRYQILGYMMQGLPNAP
jgi:hypothetical protein